MSAGDWNPNAVTTQQSPFGYPHQGLLSTSWPYYQQPYHQVPGFLQDIGKLSLSQGILSQMASGSKPLVVCSGAVHEEDTIDKAQALAERLAHQHQCDAFILKPITKVSPKREVVTTQLK